MKKMLVFLSASLACFLTVAPAEAQTQSQTEAQAEAGAEAELMSAVYDEALATQVGADDYGMRSYVLVVLKTGPKQMPAGPERDEMFRGHFANMKRLSEEGKLVLAGPFDGVDGWRGMFVYAVQDVEEARKLAETDPVLVNGEMIAEYHKYYGSAALLLVRDLHEKVAKKQM